MINIKDNNITIQKPFDVLGNKFSLLFQNTTTKEINIYDVTDDSENLYFHFEMDDFNLMDGEYYLLVLANNNHTPIEVLSNNINNYVYQPSVTYLILCGDSLIINKDVQIVTTSDNDVTVITRELCKVGDYNTTKTEYNNKKSFITYNG